MENSKIEWCDDTFNPWEGCTKVSPGCTHCYAEARNVRFTGGKNWGKGAPRRRTKTWGDPVKWNRQAPNDIAWEDHRPRVFCASLADWLDDEVPIEWLADLLKLIHDTPNLDWLLLTKRPENFFHRLEEAWKVKHDTYNDEDWMVEPWLFDDVAPSNVWIGTTVEDQKRADERIPALLKIPAHVRFLSVEPMLEAVEICSCMCGNAAVQMTLTHREICNRVGLHWVICGGESGHHKRPFNCDWARNLRDQCASAGVAFFMKQVDKVQPIPADLMIRQFPNAEDRKALGL